MMAGIRTVRYHVLRDTQDRSHVTDLNVPSATSASDLARNRVAFTTLLMHGDGKLYCGLTAFDNDILARFDPRTRTFEGLGYRQVAEEFEVKIHRSLAVDRDGTILGATACLYSLDQRARAPGGAIFRFHPASRKIEKLGIPSPHEYIQTITLDVQRRLVYCLTYPVFKFVVYHLDTGAVDDFDYMGSITHISALDDDGCFWGTWDWVRHWLFKYNPDDKKITYFRHGTPGAAKEANIMYPGAGPVDCMINGGDGFLYIGTTGGSLCRLDPRSAEVKYLGKPAPTRRLPGVVVLDERRLLLAGGDEDGGHLTIYDRKSGAFEPLGPIAAPRGDGKTMKLYRVHDLCLSPDRKTAFVAETDIPQRSGYLWECELAL